jgi:long-chain fatty acid transport protein
MGFHRIKSLLLAGVSVLIIITATSAAQAGGFAVREQSAWGQGTSYAGVAAGGSLSAMFWNPATMTQIPGLQSESVLSGIITDSKNSPTGGTFTSIPGFGGTGNVAHGGVLPLSYYSWQFNPKMWVGLALSAPYGLSETFPDIWAGRDYGAGGSHVLTVNATPTFAWEINNWLSVGVGVQFQYMDATLTRGILNFPTQQGSIDGAGWGYGFVAGITLKPTPTTTIGIGYRSTINQKINGTLSLPAGPPFTPAFGATPGSVNTTLALPDTVSVGLRQKLSPQWTALATFEWSNWSRIGTSSINQLNGAPATVFGIAQTIPFQYRDGYFYSVGAEYLWNERLALRAGVGYEKSPVSDQVRVPIVADNDRTWLSVGATYNWSNKVTLDFAYSHLFVKSTPINVVPGNPSFNGLVTYTGTVDSQINIISAALHYRWDDPSPPPKSKMYTK